MAVAARVPEVIEKVRPFEVDVSSLLWVMQGNEYERWVFDAIKTELGDGFIELENRSMEQTLELLRAGTPVVAQGYLELDTPEYFWSGFPDLLIREDFTFVGGKITQISEPKAEPKYVVWDVKGTTKPDEKYWMQVASYSEVLASHNLASADDLGLLAKHGVAHRKSRKDSLKQLDKARTILKERLARATPETITLDFIETWACAKPTICENEQSCNYSGLCEKVRKDEHSLYCLYGYNPVEDYLAAGITNYDQLLATAEKPASIKAKAFEEGKIWAELLKEETLNGPTYQLKPRDEWIPIPEPTTDDMFFDIEWFRSVLEKEPNVFMFGFVDADENFTSIDSLKPEDELQNFRDFVKIAKAKMESNPNAHIYHFSNPEVLYSNKLVGKYKELHEEVKFLISRMVDLCDISKSMILPGANSYSIKDLERYYDADTKLNRKVNLVANGANAMLLYYQATVKDVANATTHMNIIRDYNKDDCLSTKLLRDWLLERAA
jgi:uncharacterized protein